MLSIWFLYVKAYVLFLTEKVKTTMRLCCHQVSGPLDGFCDDVQALNNQAVFSDRIFHHVICYNAWRGDLESPDSMESISVPLVRVTTLTAGSYKTGSQQRRLCREMTSHILLKKSLEFPLVKAGGRATVRANKKTEWVCRPLPYEFETMEEDPLYSSSSFGPNSPGCKLCPSFRNQDRSVC